MKKKPIIIVAGAIVAVLGVIYGIKAFGIYQMIQQYSNQKPQPVTVSAAATELQTWQPRLAAVGTLKAVQGVNISSEVAGKVEKILFDSGQMVQKGQLLVQLDDSTEQAQLPGARAQVELARNNLARIRKLIEQQLVPEEQLDNARSQLEQAESTLEALQATIAKKAIRAPFGGQLGIRGVDLGQYVAAGTQIVSLQVLKTLYADFMLPEQHLNQVESGQKIEVTTAAAPGRVFAGNISAVDVTLDSGTRNFAARATIENPEHLLRPGMFANVAVLAGEPRQVIAVPKTAVSYSLYGDAVYVVAEDGSDANGEPILKARQTFVKTGENRNGYVAILSGLQPGDLVVTAGQLKLQKESLVTINNTVALN